MANGNSGKSSASKTTKRVTANKNVFSGKSGGTAKTSARTVGVAAAAVGAVKVTKKMGVKSIAIAFICLILAFAVGAGICFYMGKNDRFDILGEEHVYLSLQSGDKYVDEGVDIREFGINISDKALIETDLEKDENGNYYAETAGDYYISYTVKSLKFGLVYPIRKIRLVSVIGSSEGGE